MRVAIAGAIAAVVILCAGLLSAARACAHDPRFACSPRGANHPIVVSDPQKSWAFYGHLDAGQEDVYLLRAPRRVSVPVQLLVDQRDAKNAARPVAVIAGASGQAIATIGLARPQRFFEPFSGVTYFESPNRLVALPAGASRLTVSMRGGNGPQRYTLAIGGKERFSLLEIPYLVGAVYRIRTRRF